MKTSRVLTATLAALCASLSAAEITQDVEASYNASSGARMNLNGVQSGDVSEQNVHFKYVFSYAVPDVPIVRVGLGYDRYDFGFTGPALIPSTLQSLNLVTGIDLKLWDVLMRLEAQPGFYGDSAFTNSGDFNVPVIFGASYLFNKDFQLIVGLSIDPNRNYPVWGGIGFRWRMDDRWVLNITPPNPRLEYKATDDLTLYAGGQILNSTYRVNDNFGIARGSYLKNSLVEYTEIRTGAGASWKLGGKGTLEFELGYMAWRQLDYHKLDVDLDTTSGSFYGQAGIKLSF